MPVLCAAFAESKAWSPALDDVLGEVSSTGSSRFEWSQLKGVISIKIEQVCAEYYAATKDLSEPYDEMLKRLLALLAEVRGRSPLPSHAVDASRPSNSVWTECALSCVMCVPPPSPQFPNAPFTVQRLCELLLDPHRIYATSTRKVSRKAT